MTRTQRTCRKKSIKAKKVQVITLWDSPWSNRMANKAPHVELQLSRFQLPLGYSGWCLIGIAFEWKASSPPPPPICVDAEGNVLFKLMESVFHTDLFGLAVCGLAFSSFLSKNEKTIFSIVIILCVQALMTTMCLKQSPKGVSFEETSFCEIWAVPAFHHYAKSEKSGSRLAVVSQRIKKKRT